MEEKNNERDKRLDIIALIVALLMFVETTLRKCGVI